MKVKAMNVRVKVRVWIIDIALLMYMRRLVNSSALQSRKCRLIGMG